MCDKAGLEGRGGGNKYGGFLGRGNRQEREEASRYERVCFIYLWLGSWMVRRGWETGGRGRRERETEGDSERKRVTINKRERGK